MHIYGDGTNMRKDNVDDGCQVLDTRDFNYLLTEIVAKLIVHDILEIIKDLC